GIRDFHVTGVQTCALPISLSGPSTARAARLWPPAPPLLTTTSRQRQAQILVACGKRLDIFARYHPVAADLESRQHALADQPPNVLDGVAQAVGRLGGAHRWSEVHARPACQGCPKMFSREHLRKGSWKSGQRGTGAIYDRLVYRNLRRLHRGATYQYTPSGGGNGTGRNTRQP